MRSAILPTAFTQCLRHHTHGFDICIFVSSFFIFISCVTDYLCRSNVLEWLPYCHIGRPKPPSHWFYNKKTAKAKRSLYCLKHKCSPIFHVQKAAFSQTPFQWFKICIINEFSPASPLSIIIGCPRLLRGLFH